jgi:hypothetical protein
MTEQAVDKKNRTKTKIPLQIIISHLSESQKRGPRPLKHKMTGIADFLSTAFAL